MAIVTLIIFVIDPVINIEMNSTDFHQLFCRKTRNAAAMRVK